jgi:hypothetical protein
MASRLVLTLDILPETNEEWTYPDRIAAYRLDDRGTIVFGQL